MIMWMEGIYEEGQVCCYDFKVNLFSFLLIFSVAAPFRSSAVEEGEVAGIVQGRLLGLEVGMRKVKFVATILR